MAMINPPVVVVAYNRPKSLKRILNSLSKSFFSGAVELIISIDHTTATDVYQIADNFIWPHGNKKVIKREERLGLKRHVLACGDLSLLYGSIIMLEDDLYVSPYFYSYSVQCLNYYSDDENIGGISLYTHTSNVNADKPFITLDNDSDIFFLQFPSSWGQAWTVNQWKLFKAWIETNPVVFQNDIIPLNVKKWPDSSWLKLFVKYLVNSNKYFVYPRISLTTNFSDIGTHFTMTTYDFQRPLQLKYKDYKFLKFQNTEIKYDSFFELIPSAFASTIDKIILDDCSIDLYGEKELSLINTTYLISSKKCTNPLYSFDRVLKPMELNLILNLPGDNFSLGKTTEFSLKKENYIKSLNYSFSISLKDSFLLFIYKLSNKIRAVFNRMFKFS